jgi:hypothetical protein
MWFRDEPDSECASNFVQISEKIVMETLAILDKILWKKAWAVHEKSKFTETEKGETGEEKVKSMLIIILTSRGFFTKNSPWQAEESIPHIIVIFYGDSMKMCEDFTLIFIFEGCILLFILLQSCCLYYYNIFGGAVNRNNIFWMFFITITYPLHVSAPVGHLQVEYWLIPKELFLLQWIFHLKMARRGRNM